jgi:4-diphosphocytidyl-2-C-methyl-D-erythritol kinase
MTCPFVSASGSDDATAMVKLLADRASAKINLFLRITGRRSDGYHELDSIFVPVSISDRITIEVRRASTASVILRCSNPSLSDPETNLASRAARAFMSEFGISAQIRIDLEKTIPAGAGLGGGSSDAGTVLRMLTSMMAPMLHEPSDTRTGIRKIALALGADVPFFLDPRASHVTGIGERIEVLEKFPTLHLVVAIPPVEVPTAAVFKALARENWSGPASDVDMDEILRDEIGARHLVNDLEAPAMKLYPQIARLKVLLQQYGASMVSMSGSGGSVFGLFADAKGAETGGAAIREKSPETRVFVAKSL